jgi:hypothetical protein
MARNGGVSLLGTILVSGLVAAVVLVAANQTDRGGSVAQAAGATAAQQDEAENDDGGGGPPPWAHAGGQGKGHGADTWKEAWKKLTPAQKQKKMAALVKAHEQGMLKWAGCVAAAGNDASKRATCLKPLPPGLAKKVP